MSELRILQPDQFVVAEEGSSAQVHDLLSDWLLSGDRDPENWLKSQPLDARDEELLSAALARLRNLRQSETLLGTSHPDFVDRLTILIAALLKRHSVLSEATTVALLEATPGGYQIGPERVFKLAEACVARTGLTASLAGGLEILARQASVWHLKALRWQANSLLSQLQGKKPLLGNNPKPQRCWGETVRASIQAMPPDRASGWNALLVTINFGTNPNPSLTWLRRAQKVLTSIGQIPLDTQLVEWFSSLETAGPFGLTTDGSYLMRTLIWYAMLQPNAAGLQVVTSVTQANWKKTKALESLMGPLGKVAAASAFLLSKYPPAEAFERFEALDQRYGYPEGRVRDLLVQTARALGRESSLKIADRPNPYAGLLEDLKGRLARHLARVGDAVMAFGDRVDAAGEYVMVRGDLDRYRVHRETLLIERMSDGAKARADFSRVQDLIDRDDMQADAALAAILLIEDEAHNFQRFELGST